MNKVVSIFSLFLLGFGIVLFNFLKKEEKLYEAKWNPPDTTLAITINGEIKTTFPTTNAYETSVECANGTGKAEWNGSKWVLTTSNVTKGNIKCNVTFKQSLRLSILANNEVKNPLTTLGSEVSAYTMNDITDTKTELLSSTEQAYYFTYGTGWEANGTKFNLTGTGVTSSTYVNSYSSLVGKYLVSKYSSSNGSNVAGSKKTTTNLNSVYFVVSAKSSSYTYKTLSSNKNTTEALLASVEDDYGTSYYFRGAVKNNYVKFANKCWRIVRINGDNSVKIVLHNDNTSNASNPCSSINNSSTAAFARYSDTTYSSSFNSNRDDNAYIGFMYGTVGASNYANTHANINKSTILTNLETWYNNNLTSYADKIVDTVWCNDKSNVTNTTYEPFGYYDINGLGYGTNGTYYSATQRLVNANGAAGGTGPSLKCNGELSKIIGKIGLLTADELAFAGYAYQLYSNGNYLQENADGTYWWTMSPSTFSGSKAANFRIFAINGNLDGDYVNSKGAVRPAISLSPSTIVTGAGTSSNPYIVQ